MGQRFAESFRRDGGFGAVDVDGSLTAEVLGRFARHLRARLLRAREAGSLSAHIAAVADRLGEGQQALLEQGDQVLANQDVMLDNQQRMMDVLGEGRRVSDALPTDEELDRISERFTAASERLAAWPRTIRGEWLDRPELSGLLDRIAAEPSSVTLVEGRPGTGKSALLAALTVRLRDAGVVVAAIKADALPTSVEAADDVVRDVPGGTVRGVTALAGRESVVVVLDQLDALSDAVDLRSGRLNAVLDLVERVRGTSGVHVVASVRPFEREVDARLQGPFREVVALAEPAWTEVARVLQGAGHDPDLVGDALRGVLLVPAHLGVYLDVAEPGASYTSWHRLYEDFWRQRVVGGARGSVPLVRDLVDWMSDEESLWAPSSVADPYADALRPLLRSDVLVEEPGGGRIGFRHQTLFEFARARAFASGAESLVDHVRAREGGLFVRPVLTAGLTALRASESGRYDEAVLAFLGGGFREHVRSLVGEFVAGQPEPTDHEVAALLPVLPDPEGGARLLRFTAGSPRWFEVLVERGVLASWMARPADAAGPALPVLTGAARRGQGRNVLALVREHWLADDQYDLMSLAALDEMPEWPPDISAAFAPLLPRLRSPYRHHAAELAVRGDAAAGFTLLRHVLDLDEAEARASIDTRGQGTEPSEPVSEWVAAAWLGRARTAVVSGWYQWPLVAERVAAAPHVFAQTVWPWFEAALLDEPAPPGRPFMYRSPLIESALDDDEDDRDRRLLGVASRLLTALAEASPAAFDNVAARLARDDRQQTHRVLMAALATTAPRHPERALTYLLGDPRRMLVGTATSETGATTGLIRSLSPQLGADALERLEGAIEAFAPERPDGEDAERWGRRTERARLRLMRSVEGASETFGAVRAAAEAVHPDMPDKDVHWTGFAPVVAPVPTDRLVAMSDDEWVGIMDRVLAGDGAALAAVHHAEPLPPAHVGGTEEQAGAFEDVAKQAPGRARALVDRLTAPAYEPFVTAIVAGLGSADGTEAVAVRRELPELVLALAARGVDSFGFRDRSTSALAGVPGGLDVDTLDLLERWMWEAEPGDIVTVSDPNAGQARSLLFGYQTWIEGGGQSRALRALAAGAFYRRPPAFEWWTALVERLAASTPHPKTAAAAVRFSADLFLASNPDHGRATRAVGALASSAPDYATREEGLLGISFVLRHLTPRSAAYERLDAVRALDWGDAEQAYGELLWVLHVGTSDVEAERRIREALASDDGALRGLAYGAARFWRRAAASRPLALDVLRAAARSANADTAAAPARVFSSFVHGSRPRAWVDEDAPLVEALVGEPAALQAAAEGLVTACAALSTRFPGLAVRVGTAVVAAIQSGMLNRSGPTYWSLGEPLTQLALTLHRSASPDIRAAGLDLFEAVYRLGLRGAREALVLLDRSPARR